MVESLRPRPRYIWEDGRFRDIVQLFKIRQTLLFLANNNFCLDCDICDDEYFLFHFKE